MLVAFLSYCLTVTQKKQLERRSLGMTPNAAMEKLASLQMMDVCIPTTRGY